MLPYSQRSFICDIVKEPVKNSTRKTQTSQIVQSPFFSKVTTDQQVFRFYKKFFTSFVCSASWYFFCVFFFLFNLFLLKLNCFKQFLFLIHWKLPFFNHFVNRTFALWDSKAKSCLNVSGKVKKKITVSCERICHPWKGFLKILFFFSNLLANLLSKIKTIQKCLLFYYSVTSKFLIYIKISQQYLFLLLFPIFLYFHTSYQALVLTNFFFFF